MSLCNELMSIGTHTGALGSNITILLHSILFRDFAQQVGGGGGDILLFKFISFSASHPYHGTTPKNPENHSNWIIFSRFKSERKEHKQVAQQDQLNWPLILFHTFCQILDNLTSFFFELQLNLLFQNRRILRSKKYYIKVHCILNLKETQFYELLNAIIKQ